MSEVVWIVNRTFRDSISNSIHGLQRMQPELGEAKSEELF
jgi:hypothetical protein